MLTYSHKVSVILELEIEGRAIERKRVLLYEIMDEAMARSFMTRTVDDVENGFMFTTYYFYSLTGEELHQIRVLNSVEFPLGTLIKVGGKEFAYVKDREFVEK